MISLQAKRYTGSLAVCCNFDRPKGSQVLCTCLAIEAGMKTLPK